MKRLAPFSIFCCIILTAFLTAAQDDLAAIERGDGVTLRIESFTYQDTAGNYTPANGIYLVMRMTIDNASAKDVCIAASDIRLQYDDEEYPPERALMAEVQSDMTPRRDYVGPFGGHCVEAGSTEPSFAAFDVPAGMDAFAIRFDETVQPFDADNLEVVASSTAAATPRPSTARPTATPRPADAAAEQADANSLSDGIFILAGGRDVEQVRVVDGRDNGGERGAIISYIVRQDEAADMIDEFLDILEAAAATIKSQELDLDAITLVMGSATGDAIGIIVTSVPDLLDYYEGRITRSQYFDRLTVTEL